MEERFRCIPDSLIVDGVRYTGSESICFKIMLFAAAPLRVAVFLGSVDVTTQAFRLISLRHGILGGLTSTITTSTLARYWRSLSSQVICRGRGEGVMRREGLTMTVLGMWVMGEDCDRMEIVSAFCKVLIVNIL